MAKLQAVYYRALDGSEPVDDFIERLSARRQAVLDNQKRRPPRAAGRDAP